MKSRGAWVWSLGPKPASGIAGSSFVALAVLDESDHQEPIP